MSFSRRLRRILNERWLERNALDETAGGLREPASSSTLPALARWLFFHDTDDDTDKVRTPGGDLVSLGGGTSPGGSGDITDPSDIPGLALWLDASQIEGLSDGDPVTTWADQSPNGYDATQAPNVDPVWSLGTGFAEGGSVTFGFDDGVNPVVEIGPLAFDANAAAVDAAFEAESIPVTTEGLSLLESGINVTFTGAASISVTLVSDDTTGGAGAGSNAGASEVDPGGQPAAPTYVEDSGNGQPAVRFDGSSDPQYLQLTGDGLDLFRNVDGVTIAAAVTNIVASESAYLLTASDNTDPTNVRAALQLTASTGGPLAFNVGNVDGENGQIGQGADDVMTGPGDEGLSAPVVVLGAADLNGLSVLVDSSQYVLNGSNVADAGSAGRGPTPDTASLVVVLGVFPSNTSDPPTGGYGDFRMIVAYNRGLNAKERRQLIEWMCAETATL